MSDGEEELRENLLGNVYKIIGIFDTIECKLVYVHLEYDAVEMEFDMQGYTEPRYAFTELHVTMV